LKEKAGRRAGGVSRRRRGATAPGGGAGESDLWRGGELQQDSRRNRPAAAETCDGDAGGKWRARARGKISACCVFVRVRRDTARCSRRLTFGALNRANNRAPKKNCSVAADTAPVGGPIPSPRTVYRRFFLARAHYSAAVEDALTTSPAASKRVSSKCCNIVECGVPARVTAFWGTFIESRLQ
jgi:hypothetical protein